MKTTFPVTITGMNITDRNVEGRYGPQDKVGITIQETNVIDENGENVVIPAEAWLNGFTPAGAMNQVAVGHKIPIQIRTKVNPNGGFYYNFGYYPKPGTTAQAAPASNNNQGFNQPPATPATGEFVTRQEFDEVVNNLQNQIDQLPF